LHAIQDSRTGVISPFWMNGGFWENKYDTNQQGLLLKSHLDFKNWMVPVLENTEFILKNSSKYYQWYFEKNYLACLECNHAVNEHLYDAELPLSCVREISDSMPFLIKRGIEISNIRF
jgi:hypothetical protein